MVETFWIIDKKNFVVKKKNFDIIEVGVIFFLKVRHS